MSALCSLRPHELSQVARRLDIKSTAALALSCKDASNACRADWTVWYDTEALDVRLESEDDVWALARWMSPIECDDTEAMVAAAVDSERRLESVTRVTITFRGMAAGENASARNTLDLVLTLLNAKLPNLATLRIKTDVWALKFGGRFPAVTDLALIVDEDNPHMPDWPPGMRSLEFGFERETEPVLAPLPPTTTHAELWGMVEPPLSGPIEHFVGDAPLQSLVIKDIFWMEGSIKCLAPTLKHFANTYQADFWTQLDSSFERLKSLELHVSERGVPTKFSSVYPPGIVPEWDYLWGVSLDITALSALERLSLVDVLPEFDTPDQLAFLQTRLERLDLVRPNFDDDDFLFEFGPKWRRLKTLHIHHIHEGKWHVVLPKEPLPALTDLALCNRDMESTKLADVLDPAMLPELQTLTLKGWDLAGFHQPPSWSVRSHHHHQKRTTTNCTVHGGHE